MHDVEDRLREMLRRRAGDVPIHVEAPLGMLRRAWRRILMAFTGAAVAVAVVAAGAVAGVRLLNQNVGGPASATQIAPACRASDLQGNINLVSANSQFRGSLLVTNVSGNACSLQGQPSLAIVDANGVPLDLQEESADPSWMVRSKPTPKGWPAVTLYYGASASIRIDWASWCGPAKPATWRIVLQGGGMLQIANRKGHVPQCMGSSRLQVGPFEPVT